MKITPNQNKELIDQSNEAEDEVTVSNTEYESKGLWQQQ